MPESWPDFWETICVPHSTNLVEAKSAEDLINSTRSEIFDQSQTLQYILSRAS